MTKREWLKAVCPICGKEYEYLSAYKPATCGKFFCVQEAHKRGLLPQKNLEVISPTILKKGENEQSN